MIVEDLLKESRLFSNDEDVAVIVHIHLQASERVAQLIVVPFAACTQRIYDIDGVHCSRNMQTDRKGKKDKL